MPRCVRSRQSNIYRHKMAELPENLQEMARVRLEYPDASLLELGELCEPAVGKSGVNHRLRKLCELAEKMGLAQKES